MYRWWHGCLNPHNRIKSKHTITTRIEKGGRDPQAWITIALLIGDNSLELLLPMANKPQDLPSCGWVAPQINI